MTTIPGKTESSLETASFEGQTDQKLFDNYGPVNVKETIGTFFLGVLAILLFIALQRSWNRYEGLLEQNRKLTKLKNILFITILFFDYTGSRKSGGEK